MVENDELERMWKEAVVACFRLYRSIYLNGVTGTTKNLMIHARAEIYPGSCQPVDRASRLSLRGVKAETVL
jgi:hypothetical protein